MSVFHFLTKFKVQAENFRIAKRNVKLFYGGSKDSIQAPIKRRLSIKNTSPSQKYSSFLQGQYPVCEKTLLCICVLFFNNLMRILSQSATRHPSGSRPVKEIINHIGFSLRPLVRLADPRKSSVPCHVQWLVITQIGLLLGQPLKDHGRGR